MNRCKEIIYLFFIFILFLILSIVISNQSRKIKNIELELQIQKDMYVNLENDIIKYKQSTERIIDMNFQILSNGGWGSFEE